MKGKRKSNPLEKVSRDKKTGRFKKLKGKGVPASVVPVRPTRKPVEKPVEKPKLKKPKSSDPRTTPSIFK